MSSAEHADLTIAPFGVELKGITKPRKEKKCL